MKSLYAPWRGEYAASVTKSKDENAQEHECVFCAIVQDTDNAKNFVLKRFDNTFVILNRYPYNAGHVLILPNEHCARLPDLPKATRTELMEVTSATVDAFEQALKPHGFNIGFNLGRSAGGSIPSHLHAHVLPRWAGDTNFLSTLAETQTISFDVIKIYNDLKDAFAAIQI